MKKVISLIIISLLFSLGVWADSHYKYIYWDTEIYFGHVIYPEAKHDGKDAIVLREGQTRPEVADLNLPIAPGDTIRTTERRCEIQFDTGTIIRLDSETEFKIETILAQSLSSNNKLTNLILTKGQVYIMYKNYIRREIFQIITSNTAVKLNDKSVAMIKVKPDMSTDIQINEGKAYALFGPDEDSTKKETIKKGQSITVMPNHQAVPGQFRDEIEDFEAWNEEINREFLELHEGKAVIPMPIQKMPLAVFQFAQKFSFRHGEWLWDGFYGYVWRPFLNDRAYPWGGWQPYYSGRWSSVHDQLFWVPTEPWGWVPYHLGIWTWDEKKGWLWLPGSLFAPAWVDWAFYFGRFSWRPWMLADWYGYSYAGFYGSYSPFYAYLNDSLRGEDVMPPSNKDRKKTVLRVVRKDQLSKKKASTYPLPKELKKPYNKIVKALENGDERILSALKKVPEHVMLVNGENLNAPNVQEKVVRLADLSASEQRDFISQRQLQDPYRVSVQATQTYTRNDKVTSLREKVSRLIKDMEDSGTQKQTEATRSIPPQKVSSRSMDSRSLSFESKPSSLRFHDWNPDVKVARKSGVSIRYSSRSNEVSCPELNVSSRHVTGTRGYDGPRVRLTSKGSVATSVSSGAVSSTMSSDKSSSSSSSTDRSSSKSSAADSKKSSGNKVKKK
ncbi:MAG: FecR family protein [Candidatus Aminicenantes bacterium]|nr:FecR family protein [Candidatus Aminicenantes bacterium]MDH5744701.1 FecR family protein [Candidatus Aminicenantes bacterium]